jgi:[ribosomal protein S5]-alanine N-acetyltransferase
VTQPAVAPAPPARPPFDQWRLLTRRLLLRPLRLEDADGLFQLYGDPQVMRYWSTLPWTSLDSAQRMIEADLHDLPAGRHLRLAILRQGSGDFLGTCSLFAWSEACRRAELGFALASRFWGRAYMDEALRALLRQAFGDCGLNRVEADTDPRNAACARTLERLGFKREGLLRERWIVGDEVSDSALYGLLRRDWAWRQ